MAIDGKIDEDSLIFPKQDEVMNQWDMAKDGKSYMDIKKYPELQKFMRK